MRHRPAVWALVLAIPVNMLIISYVTEYVTYLTAGTGSGSVVGASAAPARWRFRCRWWIESGARNRLA